MATPPIQNKTLVTKATLYAYRAHLLEGVLSFTAGRVWNFDIVAYMTSNGINPDLYDLGKTEVQVYVDETDETSPMFGYHVDAGAVAAVGFKEDGKVRVINQHTATLNFLIRVIVYLKQV
jgi:hypothetical protein